MDVKGTSDFYWHGWGLRLAGARRSATVTGSCGSCLQGLADDVAANVTIEAPKLQRLASEAESKVKRWSDCSPHLLPPASSRHTRGRCRHLALLGPEPLCERRQRCYNHSGSASCTIPSSTAAFVALRASFNLSCSLEALPTRIQGSSSMLEHWLRKQCRPTDLHKPPAFQQVLRIGKALGNSSPSKRETSAPIPVAAFSKSQS